MKKKKSDEEKQEYSFDLDSILLLSSITYNVRNALEEECKKSSSIKKSIPPIIVRDVAKKLGLSAFL